MEEYYSSIQKVVKILGNLSKVKILGTCLNSFRFVSCSKNVIREEIFVVVL